MPLSVQEAKARNEEPLLAIPGVVSVGIGKDDAGRPTIIVGLASDDPLIVSGIPSEADGFPVVAQVTGPLHPR